MCRPLPGPGGPWYSVPMPTDVAKVHLAIYGQTREITLDVRVGEATLLDLFEPAAELSRQVSAIAVQQAAAEGKAVRCAEGCAACCRHLLPVSPAEARRLADVVARMPEERRAGVLRRFADAIARLEAANLLDPRAPRGRSALVAERGGDAREVWLHVSRRYFELWIDCPFLENEACVAYADRPLTCREYQVVTPPERCSTFGGATEAIDRPLRASEALATAGHEVLGIQEAQIPIALALEWSEVHGRALDAPRDGAEMFFALVRAAGEQSEGGEAPARAGKKKDRKRRRR
jgi:Fe-S-cluster containining protein